MQTGTVTEFTRSHGHGFIKPDDDADGKHYFLHISEYVHGFFIDMIFINNQSLCILVISMTF